MKLAATFLLCSALCLAQNPGTNAKTINGAPVPASQPCLGSNAGSQLIAGTCSGGGATGPAGGDLSGTYPNPTIATSAAVQGVTGNIKAAPYYAAGSSVATTTTALCAAGATSCAVADVSSFLVNQGLLIGVSGANASTTTAIRTITSVSGTSGAGTIGFTPALIASSSYAIGTNIQHDDSAAYQSAVNSIATTGGVFFVPTGVYRLNNCNATNGGVVAFPINPQDTFFITAPQIVFKFTGTYESGILAGSAQLRPMIQSDCTSGAMFIQPNAPTGAVGGFNANFMRWSNLNFRTYNNPSVRVLDMLWADSNSLDSIQIDTGSLPANPGPTNTNGIAVFQPGPGNYNGNAISHVTISGYNVAVIAGPHTEFTDTMIAMCMHTVQVNTSNAFIIDHEVHASNLDISESKFLIEPYSTAFGIQSIGIEMLSYELGGAQGPTWMNGGVVCNDASNILVGYIKYNSFVNSGNYAATGCGNVIQRSTFNSQGLGTGAGNDGLFMVKPTASASAPAVLGFSGANAADMFQLTGTNSEGLLSGSGKKQEWVGYWGIAFRGSNQTSGSVPSLITGTTGDASVDIWGSHLDANPIIRFLNNAGSTAFSNVDSGGSFTEGLGVKYKTTHGTNGTSGVATLASGTVTVSTTAIAAIAAAGAAGDVVNLTEQNCSGTCAGVWLGTVTAATSFVINGAATDNSNVYWEIRHIN